MDGNRTEQTGIAICYHLNAMELGYKEKAGIL